MAHTANRFRFGFSFSWELDYVNILSLLESLEIPCHSHQRQDRQAIIFGGGPVLTANPEPFAAFFDVILLGDGENLIADFINAYQEVRNADRPTKLRHLSQVPGVYVPSLYTVNYDSPEGEIRAILPIDNNVPAFVSKQTYRSSTLSASTVVTKQAAWENIYMVEVANQLQLQAQAIIENRAFRKSNGKTNSYSREANTRRIEGNAYRVGKRGVRAN